MKGNNTPALLNDMNIRYSENFQNIFKDKKRMEHLLSQNGLISDLTLKRWEKMRYFITNAINKSGTILDIGCSNGLLLKSLQEWSAYALEPYGIDNNPVFIREAQKLYRGQQHRFAVIDITEIQTISKYHFPALYDYIYWNVWQEWDFKNDVQIKKIQALLKMLATGGKLVLGFYDFPNSKGLAGIIPALNKIGFHHTAIQKNPTGCETILF